MNVSTAPTASSAQHASATKRAQKARPPFAARQVLRLLQGLGHGNLTLHTPDGEQLHFGPRDAPGAVLRLHDWRVFAAVLKSGDVGFGEAYMAGEWSSPDLPALLRLLMANREQLERAVYGSWWGSLLHRVRHALNRNSREGSRRNIEAHYDLGNDFYRLWLDETMNYSSAWFDGDLQQPLDQAQRAKLGRALDACGLRPGQRVLEIGCGWGAVAEAAAQRGLELTGVTLSTEQLAFAQARLARQGLDGLAKLRLQDYRDVPESGFDAVVSIEMFEAVGQAYWPQFFRGVHAKLKAGGRACVQSITLRDELFERYAGGTDFIQQYVFPGGMLPSPTAFREQAAQAGLRVVDEMAFGPDYAETLRRWRAAFLAQEEAVHRQGYDDRFLRLWDFYLAYCEAAFESGNTDVMQFTLQRD